MTTDINVDHNKLLSFSTYKVILSMRTGSHSVAKCSQGLSLEAAMIVQSLLHRGPKTGGVASFSGKTLSKSAAEVQVSFPKVQCTSSFEFLLLTDVKSTNQHA